MSANITIVFTHSILPIRSEKKYTTDTTLGQLKGKIERTTGTPVASQQLWIMQDGQRVRQLDADDFIQLGQFELGNFIVIHVVDTNPRSSLKELSDANLSKVQKYEMDDEDYGQLRDSARVWKTRVLAQKAEQNKDAIEAAAAEREQKELVYIELAKEIKCEDRCLLSEDRRGEVRYVGLVPEIGGTWVGVALDEPLGKNNGSIKGKKYFHCQKNYGIFIRPDALEVGDYPEEDLFDEL